MALTEKEVEELQSLEDEAQLRLDPSSDDYDQMVGDMNSVSDMLDNHYRSLRKVDKNGKVTKETPTRQPNTVGNGQYDYHFEPNVREVQAYLQQHQDALDRLQVDGIPLRQWGESMVQEPIRSPVVDGQTGAVIGYNITPGKSRLDMLTEDHPAYGKVADDMWDAKRKEAERLGKGLKRYRDIKLNRNEIGDWVVGGAQKAMQRVVAPALMGAADAATMGQAGPLGDAITDLVDYGLARTQVDFGDPYGIGDQGLELESLAGEQPRAEEVRNRNMPAYVGGNLAGGALPNRAAAVLPRGLGIPANPAGAIQEGLANAMGYAGQGFGGTVPGRALSSGAAAGVTSGVETILSEAARYANEGEPIPVGNVGLRALANMGVASVVGTGMDLGAQGVSKGREVFSEYKRNAPLRTLEEGGGSASIPWGVVPSDEIAAAQAQARADRSDPTKAPYTPAGKLAGELAPKIEQSVRTREANKQVEIGDQMREYYNHPAYGNVEGTTGPAIKGLNELVNASFGRSATDGSPVPVDAPQLQRIGQIFREYAEPLPISDKVAPAEAARTGGIVIPGPIAMHVFGADFDIAPGQSVLLQPIKVNPQSLVKLEDRIYRELDAASGKGLKNEPVWQAVNEGIKETRDQFRLFRDENGKLVPPPKDDAPQGPFEPADDVPRGPSRGEYMAPPTAVGGPPPNKPEGLMGIGPEHAPPIPENPFDPRLPTSRESINPRATVQVQGDYGPPPPLDPNARMGVGDRFNPEPVRAFTAEGLPLTGQSISPKPIQQVQGTYNHPPEVKMERAPITERNPYGHVNRGQPEPEVPLPPSERNPYAPSPVAEESLSTLAGNKLAMKAEEPLRGEPELTEEVYQREYGPTKPVPDEVEPIRGETLEQFKARGGKTGSALPPEIQAKVDDGTLTSEAQQKAVNKEIRQKTEAPAAPDKRGGLEQMLDAKLDRPDAPPVPKTEIEDIGRQQTADREQVAKNWKRADELFSKNREERAAEIEKLSALGEDPRVIEEAIEQVKAIDARLGPINREQRIDMLISAIKAKTGKDIKAEDLIRFGLISAGLVQMAEGDDESGAAMAGIGAFFGRKGKKTTGPAEAGPPKPKKPTEPTYTLKDGRVVKGFSALRGQQHEDQAGIERAMKRLGVEGDATLEGRIRTYGQNDDRQKIDQALLDEANNIGKGDDLRRAAGANAYEELKDRSSPIGNMKGIGNALIDFFGFRGYAAGEYLAGRFTRDQLRNPYVSEPSTLLGEMQKTFLEDPARKLLDMSGGAAAARWTDDAREYFDNGEKYKTVDEDKKEQRKKAREREARERASR